MHPLAKTVRKIFACLTLCSFMTTNVWATVPMRGNQHLEAITQPLKVSNLQIFNHPQTDSASAPNMGDQPVVEAQDSMNALSMSAAAPTSIPATVYNYDLIASTKNPIQGTNPRSLGVPSINDNGEIAFTSLLTDNRPWITLLNFDTNAVVRNFYMGSPETVDTFVQLNNSDQVAFHNQTDDGLFSNIDRLDTASGGPVIASGSIDPSSPADFNVAYPYPTINNSGLVAFNAQDGSDNFLGSRAAGSGSFNIGPNVPSPAYMYPIISDTGATVVQYGSNNQAPLILSNQTFSSVGFLASTDNSGGAFTAFTAIGNKPGISQDGNVIGYMGQHPTMGTGIFIFIWDAASSTWIGGNLVGLPASSNLNYRVAVNKIAATQYTIVFLGLNGSSILGLYSVTIDISALPGLTISPLTILAQVGQSLPAYTINVQNIETYYPVNTKGQVTFWVTTASGDQMIFRASPQVAASSAQAQAPIHNAICQGDPTYMHSGQFEYGCTDLNIPGRGMDLAINHQYRGQTGLVSQFGFGWSMSYNERLTVVGSNAQIADGGGRVDTYTLSGGTYKAPPGFYQTLVKNSSGTWTLTNSDGTVKNYDTLGRLSSIVDRHGNTISMAYSASKVNILANGKIIGADYQLTSITGTNGRVVDFTFNADGLLGSMLDVSTGRVTSFTYNPTTNDLLTITKPATTQFPSGVPKNFTYDTNHNILTIKDGLNQIFVTNVYTTQNKVSSQSNGLGTQHYAYFANSAVTSDNKNFITQYDFNAQGNPTRVTVSTSGLRTTDPAAFSTFNTYNSDMELTSVTYPNGNGIEYTYDSANANPLAHGNLLQMRRKVSMSQADNNTIDLVTTYTHEPHFNQIQTITDPLGNVTSYTYDYQLPTTNPNYGTQGNLVSITQPKVGTITPVTQFSYNTKGEPVQIIDPNGNITSMTYDPVTGYLLSIAQDPKVTDALTQFAYDSFGNVNKITDPNNHITSFTYNQLNWLLSTTNALGHVTNYTYDANGNVLQQSIQSNPAGTTFQTTKYTYNITNQVLTITDPLGRVTTFTYDANQNLATKKDPKANVTTFAFDERNLLLTVTDANKGVTQYNYDGNGNLQTVIDAKGNNTNYTYNHFNELTATTYADVSSETYTYDKDADLTQKVTPNAQTINYTYDALNRLTTVAYPASTTMNITRTYDAGSRLLTAVNGFSNLTYTYDALNRVTDESQILAGTSYPVKSIYDKAGNRTQVTYPSAKFVTYGYNALNQVNAVSVNGVALASYAYDTLNRLTTKTFLTSVNQTSSYAYDLANELTGLSNTLTPAGTVISKHSYAYDGDRNRTSYVNQEGSASTTANYFYDKINQLTSVTGAQAHTYAYDTVGNRTTADGSSYVSNVLNQYTSVAGSALTYDKNGNLLTQPGQSYVYDAENRQTQMTKGSTVASYAYDSFNRRVSKTVNGVVTHFVYDGDETIEEHNASGVLNADYEYGPNIDEVLTMNRAGQAYYYQYDGLGSVRNLTNASGVVKETYDYDVYGKPTVVSAVGNPVMFTGRWYDAESGNFYYRAREYSPAYGRFLQRDPIGYYDSMNLMEYALNNPINRIDPLGLWQWTFMIGYGRAMKMTFGNNGGTNIFNGQWNSGLYFGVGQGISVSLNLKNNGCHQKGSFYAIEAEGNVSYYAGVDAMVRIGEEPAWEVGYNLGETPIGGSIGSNGSFPTFGVTLGLGEAYVTGGGRTKYY